MGWVTINGRHVRIDDDIAKDSRTKEKQISANQTQAKKANVSVGDMILASTDSNIVSPMIVKEISEDGVWAAPRESRYGSPVQKFIRWEQIT